MDKYKTAGKIAQQVLQELIALCIPGADIHELCIFGNKRIIKLLSTHYSSKSIEKGVSFPVCLSQNHISAHFSPLPSESKKLEPGLLKIDLGVHIDGYPVVLAHTIFVGSERDPILLNLAQCTYHCLVTAVKQMRPGTENYTITNSTKNICKKFDVSPVQGLLSHEVSHYCIDGKQVI